MTLDLEVSPIQNIENMPLTWFITGCSSGFGESLVRQLRAAGDNVIATGRNADTKLAHLKDTGAEIIDLDVTAPVSEIKAMADRAWGVYDGIDVVVNNAGYILSGPVEEQTSVSHISNLDSTNGMIARRIWRDHSKSISMVL